MMENPLISVIIPVYKVEAYLDRCVESVVNQTYRNLEIILVDDGSPDNCPLICDNWANKDNRIVVIHKQNGGLSDARNVGLDIHKGEWVVFVDSDDTISTDMIELLLLSVQENLSSISVCDFTMLYDNGDKRVRSYSTTTSTLSSEKVLSEYFEHASYFIMACNKLFNSKLFDNIRFKKGIIYEDANIMYQLNLAACSLSIVNTPLYNYFIRNGSITKSAFSKKQYGIIDTIEEFQQFMIEHNYNKSYINSLPMYMYRLKAAVYYTSTEGGKIKYKTYRQKLLNALCLHLKYIKSIDIDYSQRELFRSVIMLISPKLYRLIYKSKYIDL